MHPRKTRSLRAAGTLGLSLLLSACSGSPPGNIGVQDNGHLAPCPTKPNCVSSDPEVDKRHRIAPFDANGGEWERLSGVLEANPRISIVEQGDNYLYAIATTRIMRFVDDLEFLYHPDNASIEVRSASRLGYSDLGVNRKRMEAIREELQE